MKIFADSGFIPRLVAFINRYVNTQREERPEESFPKY